MAVKTERECVCIFSLFYDVFFLSSCRLRNDLYCVEWDVKLYYTIPSCPLALCEYVIIFHTPVARYNLFVLKVSFNVS